VSGSIQPTIVTENLQSLLVWTRSRLFDVQNTIRFHNSTGRKGGALPVRIHSHVRTPKRAYSDHPGTTCSISEYRLASTKPLPNAHPFPTQLLDALAGYNYLVNVGGFEPKNIIVAGNSAGSNLAHALTQYLVEHQDSEDPYTQTHLVHYFSSVLGSILAVAAFGMEKIRRMPLLTTSNHLALAMSTLTGFR